MAWHVYIYYITRQRGWRTWIDACAYLAVQCVSFRWVERHLQASMTSIMWCVNYVFRQLCVSSIIVYNIRCVQHTTFGGGGGWERGCNELSVCVCGTQWLPVKKKTERRRAWQDRCTTDWLSMCVCVRERERERERESARALAKRCFVYHKYVYVSVCVWVFLNERIMCILLRPTASRVRNTYLGFVWFSCDTHQHSTALTSVHVALIDTHQHSSTLISTAECSWGSLTYASMHT